MPSKPSRNKPKQSKPRGQRPRKLRAAPDDFIIAPEMVTFKVDPSDAGMRLDNFLTREIAWRSRTQVQKMIGERGITVNGQQLGRAYRMKAGDKVDVPLPPPPEAAGKIHEIPLNIIHEDEQLIILNKQPNIIVHPVGANRFNTLLNALHLKYRNLEDIKLDVVPKLAHRIDRETSGILVAMKCGRHERGVPVIFEHLDIRKEYLAIAEGVAEHDEGEINLPIGCKPGQPASYGDRIIRDDGQDALTTYKVLERFEKFTLLHLRIHTGRQHQIRVHLQTIGHPIACDTRYGIRSKLWLSELRPLREGEDDALLIDRQALHSYKIEFPHPTTNELVEYTASLPPDMERTLEVLRGK